jgi:ABC-type sugar transport system ATPase subunit
LQDVSVEFRTGEVACLVGENGAGKSTLVKVLTGILQPDLGEIWIRGQRYRGLTPRRSLDAGVEAVHQDLALCENLTADANVNLGQEPIRFRIGPFRILDKRRSIELAFDRIAAIGVTVGDFVRPVRQFSGGQRQAIAIARATVRGYNLILFDEPTAALGVRQSAAALELIRRVAAQGVAAVVISHNLEEVFAVGDRVIALHQGRVMLDVRVGTVSRQEVLAAMSGLSGLGAA